LSGSDSRLFTVKRIVGISAEGLPMVSDDTIGAIIARAVGQQIAAANSHLGWRGGRIHDGVHQARKALRRARAVLALAAPRLGDAVPAIDDELAAIGRSLSSLRDAMAHVETLDRLLEHAGDDAALLRRCRRVAVAARVAAAQASVNDDPGLALRRARLAQVQIALRELPWSLLQAGDLELALTQAIRRTHKAHARARRRGRDSDWHRWRRRIRMLVHTRDVLVAAGIDVAAPTAAQLRLAAALGFAQDLAVLKRDGVALGGLTSAERVALEHLLKHRLKCARAAVERRAQAMRDSKRTVAAHAVLSAP
jgi:hypothetical protein